MNYCGERTRSIKVTQNRCLLAKIGHDTAENGPTFATYVPQNEKTARLATSAKFGISFGLELRPSFLNARLRRFTGPISASDKICLLAHTQKPCYLERILKYSLASPREARDGCAPSRETKHLRNGRSSSAFAARRPSTWHLTRRFTCRCPSRRSNRGERPAGRAQLLAKRRSIGQMQTSAEQVPIRESSAKAPRKLRKVAAFWKNPEKIG